MGKWLNKGGDSIKTKVKDSGETDLKKSKKSRFLRSPFKGYFVGAWRELRQVTWPNRKTAWKLTFTVVMFSLIFAVFTSSLDYGFERLAKQIFLR